MGTYSAKKEDVVRKWFVVDAKGKTLGRMATVIASILKGKTKPIYTKHVDTGDFVIVVNADKVHLTGRKLDQKMYYHHSGGRTEVHYRRDAFEDETRGCDHQGRRGHAAQDAIGQTDDDQA
jgi:large subunit ribosomal protein L13